MCLFCCGRAIVFRSVLVPCVTQRQIVVSSRMHPSLQQSEAPPFLRCQLRWGRESLSCRRHGIQVSHRHHPKVASWNPHRHHPHNAPFQSKLHRLRSLRAHAHLRRWLTACQPVPEFFVTHPVFCWFGRFSHLFPVRCHATSPNIHMSHGVTAVSAQEHNACTGLLNHDDTCHACSCTNPCFFSDCQRTRPHGTSDAQIILSLIVSGVQASNISPLTSASSKVENLREHVEQTETYRRSP